MISIDLLVLAAGAGLGILSLFATALGFDLVERLHLMLKGRK
jgi:hypothetical protein